MKLALLAFLFGCEMNLQEIERGVAHRVLEMHKFTDVRLDKVVIGCPDDAVAGVWFTGIAPDGQPHTGLICNIKGRGLELYRAHQQ